MKKLTGARLLLNNSYEASDILHATGFSAVDPFVLLKQGARKTMVVSVLEAGRAAAVSNGVCVLTPEELHIPRKRRRFFSSWILYLLRSLPLNRVEVGAMFPVGLVEKLRKAGIRVRVTRDPACPEREVKTPEEIHHMRQSQRAAVCAMQAAVDLIHRSRVSARGGLWFKGRPLTSEAVRQAIDLELLRHECDARETIVACGPASAQPHERGQGALRAHEPIVMDIFPRHRGHGYWGDLTRTVVKGRAPDPVRNMFRAVCKAQQEALRRVKAGAAADRIHERVEQVFSRQGFLTTLGAEVSSGFIHSTGHGVGLDVHEAPSISLQKVRLKKGHVITIEPGLYYPEVGGVRMEDTVEVTTTGWRPLAKCTVPFEV